MAAVARARPLARCCCSSAVRYLLALRDRLRAGDLWVEGSGQWRAAEAQLLPPALFAAMRAAGPLPVAVPEGAEAYLAERRALLDRGERRRRCANLVGDEAQRRPGDRLARPQHAAGIAEGAEPQREAEPVVVAAPPLDGGEVGLAQGAVADEGGLGGGGGGQPPRLRPRVRAGA